MRRHPGPQDPCSNHAPAGSRLLAVFLFAIVMSVARLATAAATLATETPDRSAEDRTALDRKSAERSLLQGRIDDSVTILKRLVAANPNDGQAYLLLCRGFYAEEHIEEAITACEKAVRANARNSNAQDWLGRAYGNKADHAGPVHGFILARNVRAAFEAAVASDPGNSAAVNDLSEYYVEAPPVVGGGLDKADSLADRSFALMPQQAHRTRALVAEKRKDYVTAEHEFQAAVDVADRPDALVDLGSFYERREQPDRATDVLKRALASDRAQDAAIVDAASILNEMHREPRLAKLALQQYLASSAKSDAMPAARVHVMLGKMLADTGDDTGARIEFGKALELASNYAPAKRALKQK
jgi:tetratricopeptide (TPR) repeat protein